MTTMQAQRGAFSVPSTLVAPGVPRWTGIYSRTHHLLRQFARHGWETYCLISPGESGREPEVIEPGLHVFYDDRFAAGVPRDCGVLWLTGDAADGEHRGIWSSSLTVVDFGVLENSGTPFDPKPAMEGCHLAVTATSKLYERIKFLHPRVALIRNGYDAEVFSSEALLQTPPEYRYIRQPIIGYVGPLDERLDTSLVASLAEYFGTFSVVLVGPAEGASMRGLPPNVYILGARAYEQLAAHIAQMRVCIVPFRANDQARRKAVPAKIYEYLAMGKPVVTTPFADLARLLAPVRVAAGRDDFIAEVEKALEDNEVKSRQRWAKGHSWGVRYEELQQAIGALPQLDASSRKLKGRFGFAGYLRRYLKSNGRRGRD